MKVIVTQRIEDGDLAIQKSITLECEEAIIDFPTDATVQTATNLLKQIEWISYPKESTKTE